MNTFTSFFDQPEACPHNPGSRQDRHDDTCFPTDPGTIIVPEGMDRKEGSWFDTQVESYKQKLREPQKND